MRPDPIAALAESWGEMFKQAQIQNGYRRMRRASGVADSVHDNLAQIAAAKRRVRRAAKRAEDERRTAEGREYAAVGVHAGDGDWTKRKGGFWDKRAVWPYLFEPRWRIRSRERRALPGAERPWWASNGRPGSWSRGRQNAYVRALPGVEVPS